MSEKSKAKKATEPQGEPGAETTAVCLPEKTAQRSNLIRQKKQGAGIKTVAILGFDDNGNEHELARTGHAEIAEAIAETMRAEGRFLVVCIRG